MRKTIISEYKKTIVLGVLCLVVIISNAKSQVPYAKISLKVEGIDQESKVSLAYYPHVLSALSTTLLPAKEYVSGIGNDGYYHFEIDSVTSSGRFKIGKDWSDSGSGIMDVVLNYYPIDPGDSIVIDMEKDSTYIKDINTAKVEHNDNWSYNIYNQKGYNLLFSGKGAEKLACRYAIERYTSAEPTTIIFDDQGKLLRENHFTRARAISDSILMLYKDKMDRKSYALLKVDVIAHWKYMLLRNLTLTASFQPEKESIVKQCLLDEAFSLNKGNMEDGILSNSMDYIDLAKMKLEAEERYLDKEPFFDRVKKDFVGELREVLLTSYLMVRYHRDPLLSEHIDDALELSNLAFCHEQLSGLKKYLSSGAKAFDFKLRDKTGRTVKLSDLKGKIVVMDFWYTGCSNCIALYTKQLSHVEDAYHDNKDIVFVSVSIDTNIDNWLKSVESGKYTSTRAINLYTNGLGVKDPIINHYKITGYPTVILIDKNGCIVSVNNNILRSKNGLMNELAKLL